MKWFLLSDPSFKVKPHYVSEQLLGPLKAELTERFGDHDWETKEVTKMGLSSGGMRLASEGDTVIEQVEGLRIYVDNVSWVDYEKRVRSLPCRFFTTAYTSIPYRKLHTWWGSCLVLGIVDAYHLEKQLTTRLKEVEDRAERQFKAWQEWMDGGQVGELLPVDD
jgi:hypothetical protein